MPPPTRGCDLVLLPLLLLSWLAAAAFAGGCPDIFQETSTDRQPPPQSLPTGRLALLSNLTGPERLRQLAAPLLAGPRPVGSAGHETARAHLAGFLRRLGWRVQHDRFLADTPVGQRRFASIVATRPTLGPPPMELPVLVLAAHYDSAPLPGRFVGATDSAVSCAVLLLLAEALDAVLHSSGGGGGGGAGVRLVFFDGEEALGGRWSAADSLYGSRHLAGRWLREPGLNPGCPAAAEVSDLVLLDLIGGRGPRLEFAAVPGPRRLLEKERRDFRRLVAMETQLRAAGQLPEAADHPEPFFGVPDSWRDTPLDTVDDDHTPFRRLGVPTLHLIPTPFPAVWHTQRDDATAVHWGHSAAVARVLLAWLLEAVTPPLPDRV